MNDGSSTFAAIAVMAAVTLACRCGGYFVFSRITPSPIMRNALTHLPGCIFAAYVIPALIAGPAANWPGAAATMAAMSLTRNLGASIALGVAAAWVARFWI